MIFKKQHKNNFFQYYLIDKKRYKLILKTLSSLK